MAAPRFAPVSPVDEARAYSSPDHIPGMWMPSRPGDIEGFQPEGARMGFQGPDQGFAIKIANTFRPRIHVAPPIHVDDAVTGCLGVGLRRASLFSRAPVVHDLTIAFTIWGMLDPNPPAELVALRATLFEGVANVLHHYAEARAIVDLVPEATLRMTPQQVTAQFPGSWQELLGV